MVGRFQSTEAGFILEGEVRPVTVADGAACSVVGAEPDAASQVTQRSLLEVLKRFEGQSVRITVEVVERRPVDDLREAIERFRRDAEDTGERASVA